jgi:hypothetical protein
MLWGWEVMMGVCAFTLRTRAQQNTKTSKIRLFIQTQSALHPRQRKEKRENKWVNQAKPAETSRYSRAFPFPIGLRCRAAFKLGGVARIVIGKWHEMLPQIFLQAQFTAIHRNLPRSFQMPNGASGR